MDFSAFEATPGISVIVRTDDPVFSHVAVSDDFLETSGLSRDLAVGIGHFKLFPQNPHDKQSTGAADLRASFRRVIREKKKDQIPVQRYDLQDGKGTFEQKYWKITNVPL